MIRWLKGPAKKNVRPSTYARYEQCARLHLIPMLGRIKLKKLSAVHLEALYDRKTEEGLSAHTVNYVHTIASKALGYAVAKGLLRQNVASLAEAPRPKSPEMRYLTKEQAGAFLKAATGDRLEALYVLALATGLRRSEILGLKWEDVDLDAGVLEVRRGLTVSPSGGVQIDDPKRFASRRSIDLGDRTIATLKAHRKRQKEEKLAALTWQDDGFVFTTHAGGYLHPQTLYTAYFKPLRDREGLPPINFHELRHTYATLALRNGVPVDVVSKTLGHKDIATTLRTYAHVLPGMGKEAARTMDSVLF
jgi:integrase